MPDPVFAARDTTKVYHMGEVDVHALRGVSLDLYESEFLVLLGPSGCGKSTLLNVLGGLDVPTSGSGVYRGQNLTEADERALTPEEALQLVNLGERMDHLPSQLSGGEQQRVAIARAVAKRPDVLLCDEPTGALDIATGILVLEAIAQVNRELGTTTAVITHNAAVARNSVEHDRGAILSPPGTRAAVDGVVSARVPRPETAQQRGIGGVDDGADL